MKYKNQNQKKNRLALPLRRALTDSPSKWIVWTVDLVGEAFFLRRKSPPDRPGLHPPTRCARPEPGSAIGIRRQGRRFLSRRQQHHLGCSKLSWTLL